MNNQKVAQEHYEGMVRIISGKEGRIYQYNIMILHQTPPDNNNYHQRRSGRIMGFEYYVYLNYIMYLETLSRVVFQNVKHTTIQLMEQEWK